MKVKGDDDSYVLDRGLNESIRLDAQHLLWSMHLGYSLHPLIDVRDGMQIADLGCGTGIWLMDVARALPDTVRLHGLDISDQQFPARELWPANLTFSALDAFAAAPPAELQARFDVVHLGMWTSIPKARGVDALVDNVKMMLSKDDQRR
ncbi:hypothetical protein CDD83_2175 [Cordyceps sp. RAO-2017]|nr:hypothetical protein CDD83_2175 [Cordyceps sp. RAO-2017]